MRNRPILIAGVLLTLGVLLSQAPRLLTGAQAPPPQAVAKAPTLPRAGTPAFLTPQEVRQLMQAGMPVHIGDVRKANAYERRHIQGALSLPRNDMKSWGPKLSKEQLLVLYCA